MERRIYLEHGHGSSPVPPERKGRCPRCRNWTLSEETGRCTMKECDGDRALAAAKRYLAIRRNEHGC